MALNNIQARVERSVFKAIERVLVEEGYWPDNSSYPNTDNGNTNFEAAVKTIVSTKGFAIQPFGHSTSHKKGAKQVPRIAIISRKVLPGEIGNPINAYSEQDPNNPNNSIESFAPLENLDIQMDLHLVSGADNVAAQDRVMNAVIAKALGSGKFYVPFYDSTDERFFMKQYNYYDLPDPAEGIEEKVYSYDIKDLYLSDNIVSNPNVAHIKEILLEIGFEGDPEFDTVFINSSGIFYGSLASLFIDSPLLPISNLTILGVKIGDTIFPINQVFPIIDNFLTYLRTDFIMINEDLLPANPTIEYNIASKEIFLKSKYGIIRLEIMAIYQTEVVILAIGTIPTEIQITDPTMLSKVIAVPIPSGEDSITSVTLDILKDCEIQDVHEGNIFLEPNEQGWKSHDKDTGELVFPDNYPKANTYIYIKKQQIPA